MIADFFENLYYEEDFHRPTLEGLHFPSISLEMKQWMEMTFEEEIFKALNDCAGDKTPGPNGFNFAFIKAG